MFNIQQNDHTATGLPHTVDTSVSQQLVMLDSCAVGSSEAPGRAAACYILSIHYLIQLIEAGSS